MIEKTEISKKEYNEIIDEIYHCQRALAKRFDAPISNAISRLIKARIKLALSTIDYSAKENVLSVVPNLGEKTEGQ